MEFRSRAGSLAQSISLILVLLLFLLPLSFLPNRAIGETVVVSFTTVGTTSWTAPNRVTSVEYLVVGGGGGGGGAIGGGGGGAGGFRTGTLSVTPGQAITVTVGAGGTAGSSGGTKGGDGGQSAFGTIIAAGGGGGGTTALSCTANSTGADGGSGGGSGAGCTTTAGSGNTPSTSPSQGNNGGTGYRNDGNNSFGAGGGGGAGAAGSSTSNANGGAGGTGTASSITGTSITYAGGGGGGTYQVTGAAGSGGSGGGGAGGDGTAGTAGTANTGGGGGGGSQTSGGINTGGGAGGSGIVVISYNPPAVTISGGVNIASNLDVRGSISKGSGTFVIDHPLRPRTHLLYHSFVESPDAKNIYDGVAHLDANGEVTIKLPDYFQALNESFRYQYFPHYQPMPDLHIKEEVHDNQFTIGGGAPFGEISWQVTGNRKDPYIQANPIRVEVEKGPSQPVDKGEYLFPDYPLWENGTPPERTVSAEDVS